MLLDKCMFQCIPYVTCILTLLPLRNLSLICICHCYTCRSQWPSGLRRGSAAARLLVLRVRIPPGAWMFVSHKCCVLSGRGLCIGLITRPEEIYRVWCVQWVWLRSPVWSWGAGGHDPASGRSATGGKNYMYVLSPSGPASWSSGQGLWLLIMRSQVRFPVLPRKFFVAGKKFPWWPWSG